MITDWVEDLVGDEWEEYCHALLRQRYLPVDVQAVPAVHGDLGVDFWIRGVGDIYQCYGTEFADSVAERLRLQKRKLADEVRKLRRNSDRIAAMIAPACCRRYIFLVPRHDSRELLEYAALKAQELREAQLTFCTDDFEIAIQCMADFTLERKKLDEAALAQPRLIQSDVDSKAVHDWLTDNGELASTIREKIEVMHPSKKPEQIADIVGEQASSYLRGTDAMSTLQQRYPELYERTRRVIIARRQRLRNLGGSTGTVPMAMVTRELDTLSLALCEPPVGIDPGDAMTLSTGTVAMWLADCTLDPR